PCVCSLQTTAWSPEQGGGGAKARRLPCRNHRPAWPTVPGARGGTRTGRARRVHTRRRRSATAAAAGAMATMAEAGADRLVWVDLEMSGLDVEKDVILEVALVVTDGRLRPLGEPLHLVLHAPD